VTRKILSQADAVIEEVQDFPLRRRTALQGLTETLATMMGRVRQVVQQAKARIFDGLRQFPGKIVSLFEPHTEIIRKGKASKPTEFGKLVQIQEAENQIITHYEVFAERPSDSELLMPAVEEHQRKLGRVPRLAAADAGFYSQQNEKARWEWTGFRSRTVRLAARSAGNGRSSVGSEPDSAGKPEARDASAC
jgi:IS5 family transposase